jgi:hypothetical protein
MFKSISLIRNVFEERHVEGGIDVLYHSEALNAVGMYPELLCKPFSNRNSSQEDVASNTEHPQGGRDASNTGTIIVAFASSQNTFRIFMYQVCLTNEKCFVNLKNNLSLVRNSQVVFPAIIQTFSLQYSLSGFPMLLAISRHGRMYRTGNLMKHDGIISFVECNGITSRENCPLFIGMDLISVAAGNRQEVDAVPQSNLQSTKQHVNTKYSSVLVCGTSSLSPPLIVMLPARDQNVPMTSLEISGLEDSHHAITAIKMVHKNELNITTWNGLRHLWISNAKDDSCEEPRWDSTDISVAMIGLANGSIYAAFFFTREKYGNEREEKSVSRAVKVRNPKHTKSSIISFCLVQEKESTCPFTRLQLICVDSMGCMIMIEKVNADSSYRFQRCEPYPMLNTGHVEAAFPIISDPMNHSIITLTSEGTTYLMNLDASIKGPNQKKMLVPLTLPLRNDIRKMACCTISLRKYNSPILLIACLTKRKSFHLFYHIHKQAFSPSHFEGDTQIFLQGSSLDTIFQRLAATGASKRMDLVPIPAMYHSESLTSTRKMFDSISPFLTNSQRCFAGSCEVSKFIVEMNDKNLSSKAESSTKMDFTAGKSSTSETRTEHLFQPVPASTSLMTPLQCCKLLGTRNIGAPTRSKLLPVFHGGEAQCNSAFANKFIRNPWWGQLSKNGNYTAFASKCLTLEETIDSGTQTSLGITFACSDLKHGRFGVAVQIAGDLAMQFIPINHCPQDMGIESVVQLYENVSETSVTEKERELIICSGRKQQMKKIEALKYSSGSIVIPKMILKYDLFYHGKLPGIDGNFIVSVKSKNENEDVPFDVVDIVSSSSERTGGNILFLQSYLTRRLICGDKTDRNNENIDAFLVHTCHILSGRETKRSVKIMQQICNKLKNDHPSSGICLELHKKLRSTVQLHHC